MSELSTHFKYENVNKQTYTNFYEIPLLSYALARRIPKLYLNCEIETLAVRLNAIKFASKCAQNMQKNNSQKLSSKQDLECARL